MPTVKGKLAKDIAKRLGLKSTKRHKYRAVPTIVEGVRFASKKEAARYVELKEMELAGEISDLKLQYPFEFKIGGKLMFTYYLDFMYSSRCVDGWTTTYEDTKGFLTPVYKLKKKIIEAHYCINILET